MIRKIIKSVCLVALLSIMLLPFLKQHTDLLQNNFEVDALGGYFPPVDSAHFSVENWMDGIYQNQTEKFLKRDLKFRPYAIRFNNQLHYDWLGETRSNLVIGKDDYLFEKRYINASQGLDFIGTKKIEEQAKKLKALSEYFKREKDLDLIVMIAPDKAQYFKEKIPAQYDLEKKDSTNYKTYLKYFAQHEINVVDFNQYFLEQKSKTKNRLLTKHGVHWSLYGGLLATDSIMSYVGKLKGKVTNRINKNEIIKTTEAKKEDDDIAKSINLYYPLQPDTFSYFDNYFTAERVEYRPNIAMIGDSFCWTIWGQDIPHHYWGQESLFLYYFNEIWDTKWSPLSGTKLKDEQKLPFMEKQDVILLLYTPMNMNAFGSDFIDDLHELVFDKD